MKKKKIMFTLRQVFLERAENVQVGHFKDDSIQPNIFKLDTRLSRGTFCVYRHNVFALETLSADDYIAVYTCSQRRGCRLKAYTLVQQRLLPVFKIHEEEGGEEEDIYLTFGETLLECQSLVEGVTGLKLIA